MATLRSRSETTALSALPASPRCSDLSLGSISCVRDIRRRVRTAVFWGIEDARSDIDTADPLLAQALLGALAGDEVPLHLRAARRLFRVVGINKGQQLAG
jgi:hypothetical protein